MSDTNEPTVEEINAELEKSRLEMEAKVKALQERLQVAQRAEEEKARKAEEARQKAEAEEKAKAEKKAERVRRENRKRLYRELIEFKERAETEAKKKAEEEENAKAEKGMKLATPADLSAIELARRINAENAKNRDKSTKPRAGSSKAATTPTPAPKTKTSGNLARQVRNEERIRRTGKRGECGEVAVSDLFGNLRHF